MKLVFATNNDNKFREIQNIIRGNFVLISLKDLKMDQDIPENEPTIEGNAMSKARFIHNLCGLNVFADDTGLEIEALNNEPGVKSARYAGEIKNFDANIDKVLNLLKDSPNRKARFRTVIALIFEDKEFLFEGIINGKIIEERVGTSGFGYDPIFIPEGNTRTFAEMSLEDKNTISHRALAFKKLTEFLSDYQSQSNIADLNHI